MLYPLESTIKDMLGHLHPNKTPDLDIIEWASPIPYFGNPTCSHVATVGLNPSNREFVDAGGRELSSDHRRFHTLSSLVLESWDKASHRDLKLIIDSCTEYFFRNPYDGWFKTLDKLIRGTNTSFYSPLFQACHLDLIPFATSKKWAHLTTHQRQTLLEISKNFLSDTIRSSSIKLLILNGKTVVENFSAMTNTKFEQQLHEEWSLPRRNERPILGVSYKGEISRISGIELENRITVIGYNHNIQSSFGVTNKVRTEIQSWITKMAEGILN